MWSGSPATMSDTMSCGSSVRGESLVKMTVEDSSCATAAMAGRCDGSSSPRQPTTVMMLRAPSSASSILRSDCGVSALSTMTLNFCPSSTTSHRPGITSTASMPATICFKGTLSAMPVATAARMLDALCSPSSGMMISMRPSGVRMIISASQMLCRCSSSTTSASASPRTEYVTQLTACAARSTACTSSGSSSRLTTAACVSASASRSNGSSAASSSSSLLTSTCPSSSLWSLKSSPVCTTTVGSTQSQHPLNAATGPYSTTAQAAPRSRMPPSSFCTCSPEGVVPGVV
mmetsp:Transcript_25238/g.64135  ORF Transcript_25238/g.64135 Transcript_25238/m.64135 type:complete len:289 (-) Transcript_25238:1098-1964(-)